MKSNHSLKKDQSREVGPEEFGLDNMELKTVTQFFRPFIGRGLKGKGAKVDTREIFVSQRLLKTTYIKKRRPKDLERLSSATAFRNIGAFP